MSISGVDIGSRPDQAAETAPQPERQSAQAVFPEFYRTDREPRPIEVGEPLPVEGEPADLTQEELREISRQIHAERQKNACAR